MVSIDTAPVCTTRASVISCAILGIGSRSICYGNFPVAACMVLIGGRLMQTLVMVSAIMSVLWHVRFVISALLDDRVGILQG